MSAFSKAHRVSGISLDDQVGFLYTLSDPTTGVGVVAPIGSLLIWKYTTPKLYQKTGSGNNDWTSIALSSALPSGYQTPIENIFIKYASANSVNVSCNNVVISSYILSSVSATLTMPTDLLSGESETASTWYGIWLFYNPTTSSYTLKLSSNLTNPTIPSGYTLARLISVVRNNSSSNFLSFMHDNKMYKITESSLVIYSAIPSASGTILDISPYVCETLFDQILNLTILISKGRVSIATQSQDSSYFTEAQIANVNNNSQYMQVSLFGTKPSLTLTSADTPSTFKLSLISWRVK